MNAPESSSFPYALFLGWSFDEAGGVNSVVRNLLDRFAQHGELSPLAVELSDSVTEARWDAGAKWPQLKAGQICTWNAERPLRSVIAFLIKGPVLLWRLRSLCRRYSIRILNPHFISLQYFPLVLLRKLGLFNGLVILSFHGSDIREMLQSRGIQRALSRTMLRWADVLVPCSEGLRREVLMFVPECALRAVAIPNGIDADAFMQLSAAEYGMPAPLASRRIVLNIGAYEYKKGHDVLLKAFAAVKALHPDTVLVIAGQRNAAETAGWVAELGLTNDVLLLENISRPEIVALLRSAALFVLSSRWEKGVCGEGFAMALLEAAAAQKPVVSTITCGAEELLSDGETGRLVPTEDPDALAAAISDLLSAPALAAEMALRLHERVTHNFTWNHTFRRYLDLIQSARRD